MSNADDIWASAMEEQKQHSNSDLEKAKPVDLLEQPGLGLISDISVQLTVELGRAKIPVGQVLKLSQGSVVELNSLAGEPLNVFVNGTLIAQGEVVLVNERLGLRLTDVLSPSERIKRLS